MKNKIFLFPLALAVIFFASIIIIFSPAGKKNIIPINVPTINDNISKCTSDKDCSPISFCDYSLPGGMGQYGLVVGKPYGSQKCILKCQTDDQCSSGKCQNFDITGYDVTLPIKGCLP